MALLDYDRLRATPLTTEPFSYAIVPNFIRTPALDGINADYPKIRHPGSIPLPSLKYGPGFTALVDELKSDEFRRTIADKLGMDLSGRPVIITARGRCRPTDGKVHTDSKTKLVTVLLYMNNAWEAPGGRLRLLRSPDLNDSFDEVAPETGTMLVFKNGDHVWHGHESFDGERRVIQLNYVTDQSVVDYEQRRHGFSAFLKGLFGKKADY